MSILEKETEMLEKKGYTFSSRRPLKHGKAVILKKKKAGFSGLIGSCKTIYLYSVNNEPNAQAITEFLTEFKKYVSDEGLNEDDVRANFLVESAFDKITFKELQKAILKKDNLMRIVSVKQIETTIERQKASFHEEKIKEKIVKVEREITRRSFTTEKVSLIKLVHAIKDAPLISSKQLGERDYENQLFQFLQGRGFEVQHEKSHAGKRFDLVIGKNEIAVELKLVKNASPFDSLLGQIDRYAEDFEKIIIVLIDKWGNPSRINEETKRLKSKAPEKITIIEK